MPELEMPDFFGTPEYLVDTVTKCESAGPGLIRVYCASKRGNELIPLYTVVMSIPALLESTLIIRQRASELWNETQFSRVLELVN